MTTPPISTFQRQIEAALSHSGGTHTFEDVVERVEAGTLTYWPGMQSVMLTEIIDYPRQRYLHFFVAAGEMAELRAMYPIIMQWGKLHGCTKASLAGRKGWERTFLADEGWAPTLVIMERDL